MVVRRARRDNGDGFIFDSVTHQLKAVPHQISIFDFLIDECLLDTDAEEVDAEADSVKIFALSASLVGLHGDAILRLSFCEA